MLSWTEQRANLCFRGSGSETSFPIFPNLYSTPCEFCWSWHHPAFNFVDYTCATVQPLQCCISLHVVALLRPKKKHGPKHLLKLPRAPQLPSFCFSSTARDRVWNNCTNPSSVIQVPTKSSCEILCNHKSACIDSAWQEPVFVLPRVSKEL